jgi:hypothetical protein
MSKIKAIQKGTGEEAIWFGLVEIESHKNWNNRVDEIKRVLVDKEINTKNYYDINEHTGDDIKHEIILNKTQNYEYHGFKDGKLVFTMTNDNITVWYE